MSQGFLPSIRPARPQDVPAVVAMVHELADYQRCADQCRLTAEQLTVALFGPSPAVFGHVAVDADDEPVGFALWLRGYQRLEWLMREGNPAAGFYATVGAVPMEGLVPYRLGGPALHALAAQAEAAPARRNACEGRVPDRGDEA
ncbi:GNAT family N-acetyltransferase [Micromonospora sp. KC606]|uniref:GNAT family N-acetyltransferase n=1 Tax=Micromonospora sp. KC606 TaxID=2530379 RepID=UPI00104A6BD4|nr:GNAT family N-acetyltransferase [Micromonospora sp. KC606]TDC70989.1 GNAT family N-acetyltransferase [Micromonospora sp. KC606]